MRKYVSLLVLVALLLGAPGLAPTALAAEGMSPAAVMPADTALYVEVDTSDVNGLLGTLADLVGRISVPVSAAMLTGQIEQSLSRSLGRTISFQDDILSWLGDRAAFGMSIPDSLLTGRGMASAQTPDWQVVISIKDSTAASRFLESLLDPQARPGLLFTRAGAVIDGKPVVTYKSAVLNTTLVNAPDFLALGTNPAIAALLDNLSGRDAVLGADASFQHVMSLLRPGSRVKGFISQRVLKLPAMTLGGLLTGMGSEAARSDARQALLWLEMLSSFQGLGFAVRGQGKVLALDLVGQVDRAAEKAAMSAADLPEFKLNPTAARLAERIPAGALFVFNHADLAGSYRYLRSAAPALAGGAAEGATPEQTEAMIALLEGQIRQMTGIDLDADFLSWTGGEYALYMAFTPGAALDSTLVPFNWVFLLEATDTAKAAAFVDKLNTALEREYARRNITSPPTPIEERYFVLSTPEVSAAFGLVNDVFILSLGHDPAVAAGAARGEKTLSQNPIWQNALADIPEINQPILFLNLREVENLVRQSGTPGMGTQQLGAVLGAFESLILYGSSLGEGDVVATLALLLSEPLK